MYVHVYASHSLQLSSSEPSRQSSSLSHLKSSGTQAPDVRQVNSSGAHVVSIAGKGSEEGKEGGEQREGEEGRGGRSRMEGRKL